MSLTRSSHHIGRGIVIDLGTGDGRFVSVSARENPETFFIGIDPNTKPLEKPSMKATRNPRKGGLPNAMFIQAAIEDLPDELSGVADELHIHFPWGSLLKAVATGDPAAIAALRRIMKSGALLEIVIGIDPIRDRSEIDRLEIPDLTPVFLHSYLIPKYTSNGFGFLHAETLRSEDWASLPTSWARKLSGNQDRSVVYMTFTAV